MKLCHIISLISSSFRMAHITLCLQVLLSFVNDNSLFTRIRLIRGHPCPTSTFLVCYYNGRINSKSGLLFPLDVLYVISKGKSILMRPKTNMFQSFWLKQCHPRFYLEKIVAWYIGQTCRFLKTRFSQHYRRIKKPRKIDNFLYRLIILLAVFLFSLLKRLHMVIIPLKDIEIFLGMN